MNISISLTERQFSRNSLVNRRPITGANLIFSAHAEQILVSFHQLLDLDRQTIVLDLRDLDEA